MKLLTPSRKSPIDLLADPEYGRESEKLANLKAQLSRLDIDVNSAQASRARQTAAGDNLRARAVAVLDGGPTPDPTPSHAALAQLYEDRTLLHETIRLQQKRLDVERARASHAICEKVKPEYQRIVKRLAAALVELAAVLEEEDAFRMVLRDNDISFSASIYPMNPLFVSERVGRVADPLSNIAGWLSLAREHGYL